MANTLSQDGSPATLVAIIVAARKSGNRDLERQMRRELKEQFQVTLSFARELESECEHADT